MNKMIFVSFPVSDLARSTAFYTALGFRLEPRFSNENGSAMQWSDDIVIMLVTRAQWAVFTDRPIPSPDSSEMCLCVNCDSREEVDRMLSIAAEHGAAIDVNPPQDHGFMYQRTIVDPDGHVWEPMWMDPAVASGEAAVPET